MQVTTTYYRSTRTIYILKVSSYEIEDTHYKRDLDEGGFEWVVKPEEEIPPLLGPNLEIKPFDSINAAKRYNRLELGGRARKCLGQPGYVLVKMGGKHEQYYRVQVPGLVMQA